MDLVIIEFRIVHRAVTSGHRELLGREDIWIVWKRCSAGEVVETLSQIRLKKKKY